MRTAQVKLAALGLAAAAVLLAVWRLVEDADAPTGTVEEVSVPEVAPELAVPGAEGGALSATGGTREGIATRDAPAEEGSSALPPVEERITLSGTFVDASSRRLVTASVALRLYDERWEEHAAQTYATGCYDAPGLRPGRWRVFAQADGYCKLRSELELEPGTKEQRRDLVLRRADSLAVKLVGADGRELDPNALVAQGLGSLVELRTVATRDEPGRWLVQESKDRLGIGRYLERRRPAAFGGGRLGGGRGSVRVQYRGSDRVQYSYTMNAADGPTADDVPAGCLGVLQLDEPLPAWVSLVARGFVLRKELVFAGATEVVFTLDGGEIAGLLGSLRFRVLDAETGLPAKDFAVTLDWKGTQSSGSMKRDRGGPDVSFDRLPPGPTLLRILADGREPVVEQVVVQPGVANDLGTFRLQRLALIRARVLDQEGKPASVQLNVFPLERYASTRLSLADRIFQSNAEGELKIDSVGRGRYLIRVCDESAVGPPVVADTTFSDADGIEIRVFQATPVVLRFRADPPTGARVSIYTSSDLPVLERTAWTTDPIRVLLAPGSYSVQVDAGESWLWTQGLRVESVPVDLVLGR